MAGEPPETPFSVSKRNSAGGNLKKAKGFFWWGAAGRLAR
jgi:hypothetical protein